MCWQVNTVLQDISSCEDVKVTQTTEDPTPRLKLKIKIKTMKCSMKWYKQRINKIKKAFDCDLGHDEVTVRV